MSPEWSETLLGFLTDASVRAILLVAAVTVLLAAFAVRSNRVRHAAWTAVLLGMLLMPALTRVLPSIAIPIPAAFPQTVRTEVIGPPVLGTTSSPPSVAGEIKHNSFSRGTPQERPRWPLALASLYFIGAAICLSRALLGWRATARVLDLCRPVAPGTFSCLQLRNTRAQVCESTSAVAPFTAGVIFPRVVLPLNWQKWPAEKITAVLAHEFSHVHRRDTLIGPLASLNCCLFWFHPLAWWLQRKLAAVAELACDDDAIRATGKKEIYVQVLLDMARAIRRRGRLLAWQGVGVEGNGFLNKRIDRILRGDLFCDISRPRKILIALGCAISIVLVAACRQRTGTVADPLVSQPAQMRPYSFWAERLLIVTDPVNAPFEYGDGTGVQGFEVDIGNAIAQRVGKQVKWIKAPRPGYPYNRLKHVADSLMGRPPADSSLSDYEHLFQLLKNDDADILVSAVAVDPSRLVDFAFSQPYYSTGDVIAVQRNRNDIRTLSDLSGKKVGVVAGRPGDTFMAAQKTADGIDLIRYSSMDDAMGTLNRKEIDAVVGDAPLVVYGIKKSFHNLSILPFVVNRYQYAAVVRKGETELLAKINSTIESMMSTGDLAKIDKKWLGELR